MSILNVKNKETGEWLEIQVLQGPAGETPTLKVGTTETGEAGTDANVTMKQNGTEYTLDFVIPKGDKGDTEDLNNYYTKTEIDEKGYLTEHQDLSDYAKKVDIPTKLSGLENDEGYITNDIETDFNIDGNIYLETIGASVNDKNASRIIFGTPDNVYSYLASNNVGAFAFSRGKGNITLYPNTDNNNCIMSDCNSDLGRIDKKWKDLYLGGNLKDGTNTIPISNIATKNYVDESGFLTLETLPKWDGGNK